jgi:hypothetical protein
MGDRTQMKQKQYSFGVSNAVLASVWVYFIRSKDPELGKIVNEGNVWDLINDIAQTVDGMAKFKKDYGLSDKRISKFIEVAILEKLGAADPSMGLSILIEKLQMGEIKTSSKFGQISGVSAFVSHAVEEKIERDTKQSAHERHT